MSAFHDNALMGASGQQGYKISRSVRLRSSASAYFNRTPASAGNRKTWTWSGWVKRGSFGGAAKTIISAGASGTNPSTGIQITGNEIIQIYDYTSSYNFQLDTTPVYRDPSSWYHIVVAFDTTQATASNRIKLYVNGSQVTAFSTATYPTQNTDYQINSTNTHYISRFSQSAASYLDGYLTEINFIDGQALTPSSFGETDSITGVWKPKKYAGTYGTNGFYLNFSDNSAATATTIGKDYSGNGNNWTPNNISVTSGVTYDSMIDVPTLYADGGNGRGNYAVWNPVAKTSTTPTITNGNLQTATPASGCGNTYATIGIPSSGKWYWEVTFSSGANSMIGVAPYSVTANGEAVTGALFYYSDGRKFVSGTGSVYGASYTTNDIIGVAADADTGAVTFYKNGTSQGSISVTLTDTFPSVCDADPTTNAATLIANFGQRPFSYTPPTGFVALNTQNLPAPTISNGAQYMAATTYTGNGTSQTITNAGGFAPDLVWIKGRSYVDSHTLFDTVRGATQSLSSNTTTAEVTRTTALTAFTSTGFTVSSDTLVNYNANTLVGWQWKAGGTSSSNTNGSITSTVSVGATQGFSVVTYTGTGANATVGHGLGVAPKMVIVKVRSTTGNWLVGHTSIAWTNYLWLDSTNASAASSTAWNNTSPTSSVFSVGGSALCNGNGSTYVAYCFSEVAGFSKFGSYTGNGSADGPFLYCGFRPRWVMVKCTSSVGNWQIIDTSRDTYNDGNGLILWPNLSNAETSFAGNRDADVLSNGFKLRGSDSDSNANGATYIYAAFSENPFKLSLAR